jgi:hypothetical protein
MTGAQNSLAGDDAHLTEAGSPMQCRSRLAVRLDREADRALFVGQYVLAECLSHRAADLRGSEAL